MSPACPQEQADSKRGLGNPTCLIFSHTAPRAARQQRTKALLGVPRCAAANRRVPHGAGKGTANGQGELGGCSDVGTAAAWLKKSESVILRTGSAVGFTLLCAGFYSKLQQGVWGGAFGSRCPLRALRTRGRRDGGAALPGHTVHLSVCLGLSGCFSLLLSPSTRNPEGPKPREPLDPSANCRPAPSSGERPRQQGWAGQMDFLPLSRLPQPGKAAPAKQCGYLHCKASLGSQEAGREHAGKQRQPSREGSPLCHRLLGGAGCSLLELRPRWAVLLPLCFHFC